MVLKYPNPQTETRTKAVVNRERGSRIHKVVLSVRKFLKKFRKTMFMRTSSTRRLSRRLVGRTQQTTKTCVVARHTQHRVLLTTNGITELMLLTSTEMRMVT